MVDFFRRLMYGKLNIDEVHSPIFSENKNEAKQMFFEQYSLKMDFSSFNGWVFTPNQQFNITRVIDSRGNQKHIVNERKDSFGFFSGSTGWGWGIFKEEDMISYNLAKNLDINCINFSQVAYSIIKIYYQILNLKLQNKLPDENIIYFGINEVFTLANNMSIFENPRDLRVNKSIKYFEKYYYNIPLDYKQQLRLFIKRILYDRWQIKNYFFKRKEKNIRIDLDKIKYNKHKKELMNIINEINNIGNFIFVLEPSLFHKKCLTNFEQSIIDKYKNTPFRYVFNDLYNSILEFCNQKNIIVIGTSSCIDSQDDVYWDYCHPSNKITKKIADEINKGIKHVIK